MALRTGAQYLASLRDGREVYLDGRRVEDVTAEPGLSRVAETFAHMYDMVVANPSEMAFADPDGEMISNSWIEPRTREDLVRRRHLTEAVARLTGGLFGRSQEYVPLFHLGLMDIRDRLGRKNPAFANNIESYWARARKQDLMLAHAFAIPAPPAGVALIDSQIPKIVSEDSKGIVIRGVKTVATFAVYADEVFVGSATTPGMSPEQMLYFSIPLATPGLKIIARSVLGVGSDFDHPGGRFGDENDAILVFDNVFIPWERVFLAKGDPADAAPFFPMMARWAHWDVLVRLAVKAEVLVGLYALLPKVFSREARPASQEALAEVIRYLITIRAFIEAAEHNGAVTERGYYAPAPHFILAGRTYSVEHYRRILNFVHDISTEHLITIPTEAAYENPAIAGHLEDIFPNPVGTSRERTLLTRLAWDYACDSFGARQTLFELLNSAPFDRNRAQLAMRFDTKPYEKLAAATAGIGSLEEAKAEMEAALRPAAKPAQPPVQAPARKAAAAV